MDELPEGFMLDSEDTGLPEGFVLDTEPVVSREEPAISLDLTPSEEPIGLDIPDTVQAEDTRTTMTLPEVEQSVKQGEETAESLSQFGEGAVQTAAGMRQSVSLPAAKVLEDSLGKLGIDIGTESSQNLTKVNRLIEDYNKEHPDQLVHPATIGNAMSQLAVPMAGGIKGVAATEAILNTLNGIGKHEDYDEAYTDAAIGAAFGASSMLLFNRLTRNLGPLSYEAKLLIDKHPELNEADVIKTLEGVPKEDQAYALSNIVEDDFIDFVSKAVAGDNRDKLVLKQQLADRTKLVKKTVGNVEKQVEEAKKYFGEMVDEVAKKFPNQAKFDSMIPDLDSLIKRYDGTPNKALSIAKNMKADLEAGEGLMDVRTALQFRKDLNYLIDKSSRHEEKSLLQDIKGRVDKFVETNMDDEHLELVKAATTNYRRAKNNEEFLELMSKHTKKKATDWVKLKKNLKKAKLDSPEVNDAIDIVKEFSTKFKNDTQLRIAGKTTGQKEDAGGLLGVYSYAISTTKDALSFWGKRYRELKIQKSILKSIRQAKSPLDAFKKMEYNGVPSKLVKDMQRSLVNDYNPPMIEYKPSMKTTGDIDVATKYGTEKGTIGKSPSQVALHDSQMEVLQETLGKDYKFTNSQIEQVDKIVNSKRVNSITQNVSRQMKADDKAGNTKMLKKIIDQESELIIKRIQKDMGIKLPKSEAEKIYKLKLQDMLKDC